VGYEMANCFMQINTSCGSEDERTCSSLGNEGGMKVCSEVVKETTFPLMNETTSVGESGSEEEIY
jgi:hypothetical protein